MMTNANEDVNKGTLIPSTGQNRNESSQYGSQCGASTKTKMELPQDAVWHS